MHELILTDEEMAMQAGHFGPAARIAMRVLSRVAPFYGAERLLEVTRAHIDGCIYAGDTGLAFIEHLAELGGRVRVPSTLNVMSMDRERWREIGQDERYAARARRFGQAYVRMGARPTFTCAPYQTDAAPVFGELIAWSESNAVCYANTAIGARTNRYGDYLDISCALTGRAPAAGLYLDENRKGTHLFNLREVPHSVQERQDFFPVLGYLIGERCPDGVPVINGLDVEPTSDDLKALCAAAATSGAVALIHLVGITPEAPDLQTALGGKEPCVEFTVGMEDLRQTRAGLTTLRAESVDVVAFGSPHCSLAECRELAALMQDRRAAPGVQVFVTTSSMVRSIGIELGIVQQMEAFGAQVTADTCIAVAPLVKPGAKVLMTNSAKYAHYGPGLIDLESVFGSTSECVESAVAGRPVIDERAWTDA